MTAAEKKAAEAKAKADKEEAKQRRRDEKYARPPCYRFVALAPQ